MLVKSSSMTIRSKKSSQRFFSLFLCVCHMRSLI